MTLDFQSLLRQLSGDGPKAKPASNGVGRRLGLYDAGELTELLAKPKQTRCPHCDKLLPPPELKTRRRRLYEARTAAGTFLHLEIES